MVFSKGRAIKAVINTKGRIVTNRNLWVVIATTMPIVPRQLTKDQYPVCRKKTKQNKLKTKIISIPTDTTLNGKAHY